MGFTSGIIDEMGIALANIGSAATGAVTPTLRLGVTGLSRAGKTIFITALIHNLLTSARLPGFSPLAEGRLIGAKLGEHPDRGIPRFEFEQHLADLTGKTPKWPNSTRRISQIRLVLKFQSNNWLSGLAGPATLNLDIVDYPGEWLLDLPLLSLSYAQWSKQTLDQVKNSQAIKETTQFIGALDTLKTDTSASEPEAMRLTGLFTQYLRASRGDGRAMSALAPGRFLMPGELEGSPALTFSPLPASLQNPRSDSLYAMMMRRYDAYKALVVRPFFRTHFARLDRQIVLVDALRALNAGPDAVSDLEDALSAVLTCFRQGSNNPLSWIVARKIDRILFAATKADHVHHTSHDRLQQVLQRLVANAVRNARFAGAETKTLALASIRATSEGNIDFEGEALDCLIGTPEKGQKLGEDSYDGKTEIALFPGDLPQDPDSVFQVDFQPGSLNFMRFNPPGNLNKNPEGGVNLPHIRLDKALDFLLGDWMQ